MLKLFAKIFGTKSARDLKALWPYVEQINSFFVQFRGLSNDAIRAETLALQTHIRQQLQPIVAEHRAVEKEAVVRTSANISQEEQYDTALDKLQQQYNQQLEVVLMDSLPKAFAIVKETARRLKEQQTLVVTATEQDRALAAHTDYVTLQGEQAIWHNQWEVTGHTITWDMLHYDVQLIGGIILHQGKIAEMATGEGKTLVATLPAFLNALVGKGVHIVTINDYLAKRDAAWMGPLYMFHGLTVDCINKYPAHSQGRRKAYQADIVYGTNNEFGFDYLRDNMATSPEELVQRAPHFAMVDEVDSVLIDDARTPLIISGPVESSNEQAYTALKPSIQRLYAAQKEHVTQLLQTAKKQLGDGNEQEGGIALFRAYRGLPKHKPLIKYLSEVGIKKILRKTENYYLQDNARLMPEADAPLLFTIDERNNSIELTEKGLAYITQEEDPYFFVLPDIGMEIAHIEHDASLPTQEKLAKKDTLIKDYAVKSQRIHVLNQLLKAYTLFEKDVEYIVVNNKVKIVDEQTGRVLEGRRYSDGLHQALEAKEEVEIEKSSQTYATITLQNYFRMYPKLAGMTGTAATEAGEFWEIYKLDVIVTPTHKPIRRADKDDKVYKTVREKFQAIIEEITNLTHQQGRPVLVGTTSVEISELVSRMLTMRKIKHQVLNAKHHQREAEIISEAGKASMVTIATNMAGRGTDIKLTSASKEAGGLAIVGTERHESRRVDRQLRGRAGRQGDIGSSQFFLSLEDNLMRLFGSDRIVRIMDRMGLEDGEVIQHSMITRAIERAQKKVEQSNFAVRKRLLEYDNVMNAQREVIYKRRRHALCGEHLRIDTMRMMYDTVSELLTRHEGASDHETLLLDLLRIFGKEFHSEALHDSKVLEERIQHTYHLVLEQYEAKQTALQTTVWPLIQALEQVPDKTDQRFPWPFSDGEVVLYITADLQACMESQGKALIENMQRTVILHFIDHFWKVHLRAMDELKQSVQNAVYERQDPLLIYKFESYQLFQQFIQQVNHATIAFLFQATLRLTTTDATPTPQQEHAYRNLQESKQSAPSLLHTDERVTDTRVQPLRSSKIAQRNERVTVRYEDGSVRSHVKFKTVEEDIINGACVIIADQG